MDSTQAQTGDAIFATPAPERRHWSHIVVIPTLVLTLLTALLGVMYLGYVADPEKNLHDFPIALVNLDVGDVTGSGDQQRKVNYGKQVADGLVANVPADKVDLRVVGKAESEQLLRNAQVYGAIVIPGDFSKRLGILGAGSIVPGEMERPIITLQTNPGMGAFGVQIVHRIGDQALAEVDKQIGTQLTDQVRATLAQTPEGAPVPQVSGAAMITLESPVDVVPQQFRPLPSGSGEGLTAFFYALLLLLAGMVGAMVIHTMVDAQLGFVPTEYGPWFVHYPTASISRFHTLLLKWGVMTLASVVISGVFMLAAEIVGMPISNPLALYLFSVLAMIAVGWTGLMTLAALGSAGLLVNLILFVILGLPSSGGTVPIEAIPPHMAWLAEFEPMHQVFLGVRSILYFEANYEAGLDRGIWMSLLGIAVAVVGGVVITRYYDYKGLHRKNSDA
ncbi:YhgE/Pip domain-containing protein [Nocardia rhizosphaerihabitans]|uniref:Membrane protein n=1 Tax=Nocardia rhizosphaerihabitans TaxID=1691570 RepID=A0ABQ2KIJ8_9NOCA|nr:ABC transporter permease [Nocardia rhizosphaerihabitans]GGN84556.1 membrane protein [Nocardia rhizosphaerihabitans]